MPGPGAARAPAAVVLGPARPSAEDVAVEPLHQVPQSFPVLGRDSRRAGHLGGGLAGVVAEQPLAVEREGEPDEGELQRFRRAPCQSGPVRFPEVPGRVAPLPRCVGGGPVSGCRRRAHRAPDDPGPVGQQQHQRDEQREHEQPERRGIAEPQGVEPAREPVPPLAQHPQRGRRVRPAIGPPREHAVERRPEGRRRRLGLEGTGHADWSVDASSSRSKPSLRTRRS